MFSGPESVVGLLESIDLAISLNAILLLLHQANDCRNYSEATLKNIHHELMM